MVFLICLRLMVRMEKHRHESKHPWNSNKRSQQFSSNLFRFRFRMFQVIVQVSLIYLTMNHPGREISADKASIGGFYDPNCKYSQLNTNTGFATNVPLKHQCTRTVLSHFKSLLG